MFESIDRETEVSFRLFVDNKIFIRIVESIVYVGVVCWYECDAGYEEGVECNGKAKAEESDHNKVV